jgi:RNA polymerase sigma factor (sigma-70 family)
VSPDLTDEQLIARIVNAQEAGGDPREECAELYARLYPYVKNIVRAMVRNTSLSGREDDFVQEIFLKLHAGSLRQYDGKRGATFKTFLHRVAKNVVIDGFRDVARQPTLSTEQQTHSRHGVPGGTSEDTGEALLESDPVVPVRRRDRRAAGHISRWHEPEEATAGHERLRLIMQALAEMARPKEARFFDAVIIVLHDWGEMTDEMIGHLFGMPSDTVRQRRGRAYRQLREILKRHGIDLQ